MSLGLCCLNSCSLPGSTLGTNAITSKEVSDTEVTIPTQLQLEQWFATAKQWVETATETSLEGVMLRLMPRDQLAEVGEATLNQLFVNKPVSYHLLRELKKRNGSNRSNSVVALFDPVLNDILLPYEGLAPFSRTVVRNGSTLQEAYLALFVHELTHAADYARYPDNIIFNQKNLGNLAVRAVVEGHAQYVTRKICENHGCERGYESLRDDVVSGVDANAISGSASVNGSKTLSSFCYHDGERFFTALESHAGAIEKALAFPPTDPVMIRYPRVYLDGVRKQKQKKLSAVFNSVEVPWNPERSLQLHNTNFVPFDGYDTRKQLAQNNYEILHEGDSGVDTTNINIFWKSSAAAANKFYRRLLKPAKTRLSSNGKYEVRLLRKSSEEIVVLTDQENSNKAVQGQIGTMAFAYSPRLPDNAIGSEARIQQIYVGATGPYVISVAQFSPSGSSDALQQYMNKLLQALYTH